METPSPIVLRNKGVPVEVHRLDDSGNRVFTGDDPVTETRWVKFTNNEIADLEDAFGDLEKFSQATKETPFRAVRRALAIAWRVEPSVAGLLMIDGQMDTYATAMSGALAIANGVDPTQAVELLRTGVKARGKMAEARRAVLDEALRDAEKAVEEADLSLGDNGSTPGAEPDEQLTSSGL